MAQLFPEPTPLEALASIDRLYHEAVEKMRKAARMKDRRVARFWSSEAERLRELRSGVIDK
jgi:hypothetical protein